MPIRNLPAKFRPSDRPKPPFIPAAVFLAPVYLDGLPYEDTMLDPSPAPEGTTDDPDV